MAATKEYGIIEGPPMHQKTPRVSVGIRILNSLRTNANREIIDVTNGESISFEDLLESSCKVANFLMDLGLKQGDVIAVCSHNSLHFHKPVLAAFYTGVVVALINHTYSQHELQHVLEIARPKLVFCSQATMATFQNLLGNSSFREIYVLEDLDGSVKDCDRNFAPVAFNPDETTAAILFSSGTTGLSKGAMITHANINFSCNNMIDPNVTLFGNKPFVVLPFYHVIGLIMNLTAFIDGQRILFLEKFDEILFLETLEKYEVKFLTLVPPLMVLLAKSPNVDNYKLSVETIACGASTLSQQMEQEVIKRLNMCSVRQGYGQTETTMCATSVPTGKSKPGSCGLVIPGCRVKVRDPETKMALGPNEVGEICIKSAGVTKGYYNNEEATNKSFTEDGWLLTGDLAYYDEDKYFYIVDRLKELIKYKGFQVPPAELEALLLTHPNIMDAAVVGLPDETAGELPLAFVVKQPGVHLTDEEIKTFVANQVSYLKRLRGGVRFIEKIPKSASGKILRRVLKDTLINNKEVA